MSDQIEGDNQRSDRLSGNDQNKSQRASWRVQVKRAAIATAALFAGSAIYAWEVPPVLVTVFRWLATAATLGSTYISDTIYTGAAQGLIEQPSGQLLAMATGLVTGVLLIASLSLTRRNTLAAVETAMSRVLRGRNVGVALVVMWVMAGYLFMALMIDSSSRYAFTYYRQSLEVVTPYLGDDEVARIRSQFAQVRSKDEFGAVMEKIEASAKQHDLKLPDKEPW